jgi:hypothetical protein
MADEAIRQARERLDDAHEDWGHDALVTIYFGERPSGMTSDTVEALSQAMIEVGPQTVAETLDIGGDFQPAPTLIERAERGDTVDAEPAEMDESRATADSVAPEDPADMTEEELREAFGIGDDWEPYAEKGLAELDWSAVR